MLILRGQDPSPRPEAPIYHYPSPPRITHSIADTKQIFPVTAQMNQMNKDEQTNKQALLIIIDSQISPPPLPSNVQAYPNPLDPSALPSSSLMPSSSWKIASSVLVLWDSLLPFRLHHYYYPPMMKRWWHLSSPLTRPCHSLIRQRSRFLRRLRTSYADEVRRLKIRDKRLCVCCDCRGGALLSVHLD